MLARGHIHLNAHGSRVVERSQRGVDGGGADVGDGDVAALREQRPNEPDADAVRAAGDERGAACEVPHVVPFLWRAVSAGWIGLRKKKLAEQLYCSFSGRAGTAAHKAHARSSLRLTDWRG